MKTCQTCRFRHEDYNDRYAPCHTCPRIDRQAGKVRLENHKDDQINPLLKTEAHS